MRKLRSYTVVGAAVAILGALPALSSTVTTEAATHIILARTSGTRTITPVIGPSGVPMVVETEAPGPPMPPELLSTACKVNVAGSCAVQGPNLSFMLNGTVQTADNYYCDSGQCKPPSCQTYPNASDCNYQDPIATNCNQGDVWRSQKTEAVWDSTDGTYIRVALAFGYNCQSNWGQTWFTGDPTDGVGSYVGYNGGWDSGTDYEAQSDQTYSMMLYGGSDAPGCVTAWATIDAYYGEGISTNCF